jgi:tyrosinase
MSFLQGEDKPLTSLTVKIEGHPLHLPPGEHRPKHDNTQPSVVFDDFIANFVA